ncbi:hypothetical protein CWI37_0459p0010 [Hamiltosporidium tvaerminnensis]|uniref:Reverse transcriptase n=1 Tax=Hamiltosporidium tvaerminnensis TaxID=1176355 RepID=A0A4Q9L5N5_9MICR|nr:hypothetical protein CWI37_0459p0010 [Hamiltosporidium tvaerminnensis]
MSLKNNKVPSEDKFTAELLKYGGDFIINNFHNLIKEIWVQEKIPSERNVGLIVLIHKERFKTESALGDYQYGFQRDRSTINQIFAIRIRLEKCYKQKITIHHLFLGHKQAYDDSIDREFWNKILKLYTFYENSYFNQNDTHANKSKGIINSINIELRQGDTFFWVLFNLTLVGIIRKLPKNTDCTIFNRITQYIANTGHLAIEERNPEVMESTLKILDAESGKYFLIINETKTKYMSYEKERYLEEYITQYLNNNTGFEKI